MEAKSDKRGSRNEMTGFVQAAPDAVSPRLFMFMRDSVGAGEIKGPRERWMAPAALDTGAVGITESAWTITPETVIALRLHGSYERHRNYLKRYARRRAPLYRPTRSPNCSATWLA